MAYYLVLVFSIVFLIVLMKKRDNIKKRIGKIFIYFIYAFIFLLITVSLLKTLLDFGYYYFHYIDYTEVVCGNKELIINDEVLEKEKLIISEINEKFDEFIHRYDYSEYLEFDKQTNNLVGFPKCLGDYAINGKRVYLVEKYNCSDLCPDYGRVGIFVDGNVSSSKCKSLGGSFSFGPWGENWGCRLY